ncbi:class I adenylate-forming enzyme family protein, partial [Thermodesulfobacteriota bacterium]
MFHMGTILPILATFDGMGTFLTMTHFSVEEALKMMAGEGATIIYPTFPTITQAIINHPDFPKTDLSAVRVMNNVAPPDALRTMQAAIPHSIQVGAYGSTEVSGIVSFNELTDDENQRIDTCGRPFRGIEVRIVDMETGDSLPQGQRGEIVVRGFSLFEGYYKDPEKTAATIDAEGWFYTGDLGALDPGGRVIYLGRLKDMLKVGGENVAAAEIESYLSTYPGVSIVQVVGVPDDRLLEVPAAFVELLPGAEVTGQELIDYCKGQIASFKIPRYIKFVEDWPMSATKIQKFKLRDQYQNELGEKLL